MNQSFVTNNPSPTGSGDCGANVRGIGLLRSPAVPGKCRASNITHIYLVELIIINSRAMTLSRSQGWTDERPLSPLFSVGVCGSSGYK